MKKPKSNNTFLYIIAGIVFGFIFIAIAALINYNNGFKGSLWHMYQHSPDFYIISMAPIVLGVLFYYMGSAKKQIAIIKEYQKNAISTIESQKLIETALKKSEEEKTAVLNNTQTLICLHNMQGILFDVNDAGAKMSGYTKEELIGKNLKMLIAPEHKDKFEDYLSEIKENGKVSGLLQIITKDKQKRVWLYQNTLYKNNEDTSYIIASSIDITESVKAKHEIEKQQQFIRQIVDNSPNVIFVMNEQGEIVLANTYFRQYYTYDDTKMPLKASLLSKGTDDIFLGDIYNIKNLNDGATLVTEGNVKNINNGNTHWFTIIKKCFTGKNGEKYFLGCGMDITHKHQIEMDLKAANEMVERSLKVKDQFISNMSHEIRTPLNAVIGFTDLLADTPLDKKQTEYISIVKTASQNLLALINNILDLSKIESGKLELESLPIDIKDITIGIIKIFEPKVNEKFLKINHQFSDDIPVKVLGDQLRLSQILFNLIGNAVKFTDKGSIDIHCKLIRSSDPKKCNISFSIKDTGVGVPEDKQKDIFERFAQANIDTQRLYGGSGLGLNIAKSIVDMQGGTLTMESKQGAGTTFNFVLPFKIYEEVYSITDSDKSNAENILSFPLAQPIHVLLAEDNSINAMLAIQVLTNKGFTVVHVENGELAVEALQKEKFDVVLMDIQMPVMNGIIATQTIRQLESPESQTPIIAMTAHSLHGEMLNCYNAGMDGYIAKPFKQEDLFASIIKAVRMNDNTLATVND